jgi:protein O-GlcNAc transferase
VKNKNKNLHTTRSHSDYASQIVGAVNAGKLKEAEALARQLIAADPKSSFGWKSLGVVQKKNQLHESALASMVQACLLDPNDSEIHLNKGIIQKELNQFPEALDSLSKALKIKPNYAEAYNAIGNLYEQYSQYELSIEAYKKYLDIRPDCFLGFNNLGKVLTDHASFEEAEYCLLLSVIKNPQHPETHNNLGVLYEATGKQSDAEQSYLRALEIAPNFSEALNNLGALSNALGQLVRAEKLFLKSLEMNSSHAETYNNLGNCLKEMGRFTESIYCFEKSITLKPALAPAHNNLGVVLKDLGRLDEAELCYRRALELKPDFAEAYSSLLFTLNYHPDKSSEAIFAAYQEYDQRFCVPLRDQWRPFSNTLESHRRLRVGYVSPDFRICSARHFLEPLLANHDKSAVEVFAYAQLVVEDQMTAAYKGYVDHWVPTLGISDADLAERIRADQIDILVDTAGHSANHRLGVFARKPAPVSLSWLGFGYTTGLSAIDYYLTDEMVAPPGSEHLFSEAPWTLDPVGSVYRPAQGMGEVNLLPALSRGYVTFGTLTRSVRINHRTIRVWAQILQQVPHARLVIDSGSYKEVPIQDSLAALFAAQGISRDRLEIGYHSPWDVLRGIDIGLDCFPHNSGTTLFETLYMGIPLITLADRPSMGRFGSSILRALGRSEWIAQTEAEYVRKAVALAGDLPALASNRAIQRGQMEASPLMDEPMFARKVESAYRTMFGRWCDLSQSI